MEPTLSFDEWACNYAAKKVTVFADGLKKVVFPVFNNIGKQAEKEANAFLSGLSVGPDDDPSQVFETAHELQMEYGFALQEVGDAVLGASIAALYHLFERELIGFITRQITRAKPIAAWADIEDTLKHFGIEVPQIPGARDLRELRLVANAIKHGEGRSLSELVDMGARVLTEPPADANIIGELLFPDQHSISGSPLYLTIDDFDRYVSAALSFWDHGYWKKTGENRPLQNPV